MPEYFDDRGGGRIRIPDELAEPLWADAMQATPRGQEVELMFMRAVDEGVDVEEDVVAEVVARVFMARSSFEELIGMMPLGIAEWRKRGL